MSPVKTLTRIALALAVSSSLSTAAIAGDASIPSTLKVREFNSIASNYLERPTFVKIIDKKKTDKMVISVDLIRKSKANRDSGAYETLVFSEKRIDKYVAAIDKYLSWEEIAKRDGDIIKKKITKVKANSSSFVFFDFFSANQSNHYLMLTRPTFANVLTNANSNNGGNESPPDFALNRENAIVLKTLLTDWKNGAFEDRLNLDVEDKYK